MIGSGYREEDVEYDKLLTLVERTLEVGTDEAVHFIRKRVIDGLIELTAKKHIEYAETCMYDRLGNWHIRVANVTERSGDEPTK